MTMPFKSKSQSRLFHALEAKGKISKRKLNKWVRSTKNKKGGFKALPEKVAFRLGFIEGLEDSGTFEKSAGSSEVVYQFSELIKPDIRENFKLLLRAIINKDAGEVKKISQRIPELKNDPPFNQTADELRQRLMDPMYKWFM